MSINMTQEDLEKLVALIKPNEWQQSPFSDNLVRADFTRNVLFIVQFSEAHTRKVLDRQTKTYKEFFRPSEYIVDRIILDPNKESILTVRSDSVFVKTDLDLTQFIQKLDLDHTLDDNAEVSFEQISKS
jgi:hypothetical protein